MKLKYKVKQRSDGKWYVYKNKTTFWTKQFDTEQDAVTESLFREGGELVEKMHDIQKRLESIPGLIDHRDPYGWRA